MSPMLTRHFTSFRSFLTSLSPLASLRAQFMLPNAETKPLQTLERVVVITSFFLGSFFGNTIGNKLGHRSRSYLVLTTMIQAALVFGASGIMLSRPESEEPTFQYWPAIMMFVSSSDTKGGS